MIESEQVALGEGLTLVRGVTLQDAPPDLRGDEFATVAVLSLEGEGPSLEHAGPRLRRLQTALRLWDDAEPALGPTAWARSDGAPWLAIPLATGLRRTTEDCLLAPEEEDPLRAFCSLVARRTPRAGELAWALRRFELGCERGTPLEALTDWLLCARACSPSPTAPATSGWPSASPRSARSRASVRSWSRGCAAHRDGARRGRRHRPSGPGRRGRSWGRSAPACARSSATCCAATSTPTCGGSPTSARRLAPAPPAPG